METIEKLNKAIEGIKEIENKIKALHVVDYGDYWKQYRDAYFDYMWVGFEGFELTQYGGECWEREADKEYTAFIESLECQGYRVRW